MLLSRRTRTEKHSSQHYDSRWFMSWSQTYRGTMKEKEVLKGCTRVWKHTMLLLNYWDVLMQTYCQYRSSKEELGLSPRTLNQFKLQGKKTNNNKTTACPPSCPFPFITLDTFLAVSSSPLGMCEGQETAQTSKRKSTKLATWKPSGLQEANENASIRHENCLTFFGSTTKLSVLPIGLKKSLCET